MIYKEFQDLKLSNLGLGTMRLPNKGNNGDTPIDEEETAKMVEYAIKKGINYFDTAWGYHNGESELVIGKVLKKYSRESFYLATKFPGYDVSNMDKVEEIFEKQLEKCQVDYFDFYLFHNVYERNVNPYLDEKYGILDYLLKQKEIGRIKHLGFSVHGSLEVMKKFLEAYGKYMEFGQIQLNYLDYEFQDAKAKIELLNEYNIPIWVMEPLRGGKLAKLSEEQEGTLKALRPEEKIPAWAFRFLQSIPGVIMVLSGMSNKEQLEENIKTYEEEKPLNEEEMKISALPDDKKPSACIGCKSCEAVCPQQLKIAEAMSNFVDLLK